MDILGTGEINPFFSGILGFLGCPQPGQAGTKKNPGLPGNSKLQIPNYKTKKSWGKNFCL
ncbi:MAG: hypothetical protein JSV88_04885 [Candidatus Aminicenantes bacterium]|nr:MAG: hypothetical protein JSV88_04885 [Candidatus Aminicenantes bacterium]